jgi:transposase
MNSKLDAVTDADGQPVRFFMTAGQVSDHTGAAAPLGSLPKAEWSLADRGHDADWFREALKDKGIKRCIPARTSRGRPGLHDKRRYRIEIMFGRLKGWRRVAT